MIGDEYICDLCEHEWISRQKEVPKMCPKCKRYDWNFKSEKGGQEDVKEKKEAGRDEEN